MSSRSLRKSPSQLPKSSKLSLEFLYHPTQHSVFTSLFRFLVIYAGRRWGKTRGALNWLVSRVIRKPGSLGWWISPTYRQAKIAYRYFRRLFFKTGIIVGKPNDTELRVTLLQDCVLEFRSGEIPDNLRGEGVNYVVLDEAASLRRIVWEEILLPMLIDTVGSACFIGTPKGMGWFHELWLKGQSGLPDWKSWRFTSYDNPWLDKQEIKRIESEMPEVVARQEIWAEPMSEEGIVFRNVDACITSILEEPIPGESYTLGGDLAKYQDWTVLVVRRGLKVVAFERFNRIDWAVQKQRIAALARRYNNAKVWLDSTGVGDPIYEDLKRSGLKIEPFQFTYTSKKELIDSLILRFDQKKIEIPPEPVLVSELKAYQYELTAGGRLRTGAPEGGHDDSVMALALAFWKAEDAKPKLVTIQHPGARRRW